MRKIKKTNTSNLPVYEGLLTQSYKPIVKLFLVRNNRLTRDNAIEIEGG
jgi:hypothetical protein